MSGGCVDIFLSFPISLVVRTLFGEMDLEKAWGVDWGERWVVKGAFGEEDKCSCLEGVILKEEVCKSVFWKWNHAVSWGEIESEEYMVFGVE